MQNTEQVREVERVLVVARDIICPLIGARFSAYRTADSVTEAILQNYTYMDRPDAENDPAWKQVIPYVLVRHEKNFLLLQRLKTQGEKRLHGKMSLGVGGHINPGTDVTGFKNIIEASMFRELDEEIILGGKTDPVFIGTIYDDSTDVGRVHVGMAYILEVPTPDFTVGEPDQMTAKWADFQELSEAYDKMEGWSQILMESYVEKCLHGL